MIGDNDRPWLAALPPGPALPLWRLWLQNGVQFDGGGRWFVECGKPDCGRAVQEGARFGCARCADAAEHRFEIDCHQENCNVGWAERKQTLMEQRDAG